MYVHGDSLCLLKHCFVVGFSGHDDNRSFQHYALTPAFWTVVFTAGGTHDGHRERLSLSPLPQLLNSLWTSPLNYCRSHHLAGVPGDLRRPSSHCKKVSLETQSTSRVCKPAPICVLDTRTTDSI